MRFLRHALCVFAAYSLSGCDDSKKETPSAPESGPDGSADNDVSSGDVGKSFDQEADSKDEDQSQAGVEETSGKSTGGNGSSASAHESGSDQTNPDSPDVKPVVKKEKKERTPAELAKLHMQAEKFRAARRPHKVEDKLKRVLEIADYITSLETKTGLFVGEEESLSELKQVVQQLEDRISGIDAEKEFDFGARKDAIQRLKKAKAQLEIETIAKHLNGEVIQIWKDLQEKIETDETIVPEIEAKIKIEEERKAVEELDDSTEGLEFSKADNRIHFLKKLLKPRGTKA